MNHWPLISRAPAHAKPGDTANPHTMIDCPVCRAMLQKKVAAHSEVGRTSPSAQERRFFAADAAHWQAVLAQ